MQVAASEPHGGQNQLCLLWGGQDHGAKTSLTRPIFVLTEELQEAERRRDEGDTSAPTVRAQIPFTACMAAHSEPEILTDFWSSAAQAKTTATKYEERRPHTLALTNQVCY